MTNEMKRSILVPVLLGIAVGIPLAIILEFIT